MNEDNTTTLITTVDVEESEMQNKEEVSQHIWELAMQKEQRKYINWQKVLRNKEMLKRKVAAKNRQYKHKEEETKQKIDIIRQNSIKEIRDKISAINTPRKYSTNRNTQLHTRTNATPYERESRFTSEKSTESRIRKHKLHFKVEQNIDEKLRKIDERLKKSTEIAQKIKESKILQSEDKKISSAHQRIRLKLESLMDARIKKLRDKMSRSSSRSKKESPNAREEFITHQFTLSTTRQNRERDISNKSESLLRSLTMRNKKVEENLEMIEEQRRAYYAKLERKKNKFNKLHYKANKKKMQFKLGVIQKYSHSVELVREKKERNLQLLQLAKLHSEQIRLKFAQISK